MITLDKHALLKLTNATIGELRPFGAALDELFYGDEDGCPDLGDLAVEIGLMRFYVSGRMLPELERLQRKLERDTKEEEDAL